MLLCVADSERVMQIHAVLPVRIRMRRKAVRALDNHTKESIQHLKDDDDEMLRGQHLSPCMDLLSAPRHVKMFVPLAHSQRARNLCEVSFHVCNVRLFLNVPLCPKLTSQSNQLVSELNHA